MNPAMLVHTASVDRCDRDPSAGKISGTWSTIIPLMRCLCTTLKGWQKDSMLGRIAGASYRIVWLSEDVQNGDRVTWNGRRWDVQDVSQDNASPWFRYFSAVLVEVKD